MTKWLVGIIPAAIAAIVAAIVSLPLKSPDDAILNSGTVTIGTLIAGLAIGAAWVTFRARPAVYAGIVVAAFAAAVAIAGIFEAELSGSFKYIVPLAVIVFGICGALTPFVDRLLTEQRLQLGGSAAAIVAALGLGLGLAGQGDHETKHLSFVDSPTPTPAATSAATTKPTAAAGETPTTLASGGTITAADFAGKTFNVVPDESTVQYTVTEKLAIAASESDAQGTTGTVSGEVHLDGQASTISFDATTFVSDQDRRDGQVRQLFGSDPTVTFTVDSLSGLPDGYTLGEEFPAEGSDPIKVTGTATILGVSKPLTFDVRGKYDGTTLQLLGSTQFTWADFNIDPPNRPGIVTVHDDVRIEVLIVARPS